MQVHVLLQTGDSVVVNGLSQKVSQGYLKGDSIVVDG
jgi:hypothetical protein